MRDHKEIEDKIEELAVGIQKLDEMIQYDFSEYMKDKFKRSKEDIHRDIETLKWILS